MHRVALERADQPDIVALVDELDAYQKPLYPPESHHGIDVAALIRPNVVFAVARDDDQRAIGCGALVIEDALGEVKRMFVRPSHRGRGVAKMLLAKLESEGAQHGCTTFALETGILQSDALRFYERRGYARCAPFGNYVADPHSVFMCKRAS
ncbi:MAG TPA: GNAT family N-acetyltransferase [Casimicrobiaceae bacterium]|nr:GNAT family N-acetyltransferase [Casimicrobiaceae bacterium]